ncbi:MAG TPA: nuclear transport factor 2 family protein [Streptosporangiaceae bacterium]
MTETTTAAIDPAQVADRYLAVWSEPDPQRRRAAIAALWAPDGIEFVEGVQFRGHDELEARVAEAHEAFVTSGKYTVTSDGDVAVHDDVVTLTIQLAEASGDRAGEVAWAARVFLVLRADGLIREDYQLTVQPLAAE